nr:MAG: hypothetical protein 2 [Leviviridae sp.]
MAIAMPGTITGAAQTGLTSPTYTTTADTAPDVNAKQVAITALGGTQSGVTAHSVSSPFTVAVFRPKSFASLGKPNPTTGLISNVPTNTYKVVTRKGVTPAFSQPIANCIIRTELGVPAGADTYDAANLRAAIAAHVGFLWQLSASIGDTSINGVL